MYAKQDSPPISLTHENVFYRVRDASRNRRCLSQRVSSARPSDQPRSTFDNNSAASSTPNSAEHYRVGKNLKAVDAPFSYAQYPKLPKGRMYVASIPSSSRLNSSLGLPNTMNRLRSTMLRNLWLNFFSNVRK